MDVDPIMSNEKVLNSQDQNQLPVNLKRIAYFSGLPEKFKPADNGNDQPIRGYPLLCPYGLK